MLNYFIGTKQESDLFLMNISIVDINIIHH